MVRVIAFYFVDPSSNHAEVYLQLFVCKICLKITKVKGSGGGQRDHLFLQHPEFESCEVLLRKICLKRTKINKKSLGFPILNIVQGISSTWILSQLDLRSLPR